MGFREVYMKWIKLFSIYVALSSLALITSQKSFARQNLEELDTWQQFRNIIKTNDVRSIDDLLKVLPKDFKKGYSLLYQTRALHPNLVSPRRPRVLMFGWNGKFMMTYNSHPSGGKAKIGDKELLETIYFSPRGAELRELEFDGINRPLRKKVEVNPSRCTNCHGADPKGLWDPYNMWPGAYGSLSRGGMDFIKLGSLEHRYLKEFLEEKSRNPRYSFLEDNFKTLSQWSSEAKLSRPFNAQTMHDAIIVSDGHSSIPNQRLGMIMGEENLKRLGRSILNLSGKKINALKYIVFGLATDEKYTVPFDKSYSCAKELKSFLPPLLQATFVSFSKFQIDYGNAVLQDYKRQKELTSVFNQGLSKIGAGFSNEDPFDLNLEQRGLVYDPLSVPNLFSKKTGINGAMVVAYFLRLAGLDDYEMNIAINSARFNMYYGSTAACSAPSDGVNPFVPLCFDESIERFFSTYVIPKMNDHALSELGCDELAKLSQSALSRL